MYIADILKKKKYTLSLEFFPPKNREKEEILFNTIKKLSQYNPDFASVTYSPTGISKANSISWTATIKHYFKIESMMHITCVTTTKSNVDFILSELERLDIDNILAIRGDIPVDIEIKDQVPDFKYAKDLISYIKRKKNFCIGCAGYPEGHIETKNIPKEIDYLKEKIGAGASFVITQLFFDNKHFYNYQDLIKKNGIDVPLVVGLMPITDIGQILKFTKMCGATIPEELLRKMEGKNNKDIYDIGVEFCFNQVVDLINNGFTKLHFYTLNNSKAIETILNNLKPFFQT